MYPELVKSTGIVFSARSYIGSAQPPPTVLEDESRFGNDGTFKASGEPNWVQLPSGLWVMDFDGDYVAHGVTQPAKGTFEAWACFDILASTKNDNQSIISPLFLDKSTDRITIYGTEWRGFTPSTPIINTFYHYIMTWTDKTDVTTSRLFINGTEIAGSAGTGAFALWNYLGAGSTTVYTLDGKIALPKILNYTLSVEQAAAIYQAERHWFGV